MILRLTLLLTLSLFAASARAQYAPQAGIAGSTAISKGSPLLKGWATACTVRRGLQRIGMPASGPANLGDSSSALGAPNGDVVSLGDSGIATLRFAGPVINGPGADFAVFENGFVNAANAEEAFLELAFVEVSSDGIHFFRFPAASLTQDTVQLSSVAEPSHTNARHLNNLAGKYIGNWGTPFDLEELKDMPGLDVNAITHIRIIDAIGSIGAEGSRDAAGRKVNDPFPTPFPSSGFDLDAVGVINMHPAGIGNKHLAAMLRIYPNPAGDRVEVFVDESSALSIRLLDAVGKPLMAAGVENGKAGFNLSLLPADAYFISVSDKWGRICSSAFVHY